MLKGDPSLGCHAMKCTIHFLINKSVGRALQFFLSLLLSNFCIDMIPVIILERTHSMFAIYLYMELLPQIMHVLTEHVNTPDA